MGAEVGRRLVVLQVNTSRVGRTSKLQLAFAQAYEWDLSPDITKTRGNTPRGRRLLFPGRTQLPVSSPLLPAKTAT